MAGLRRGGLATPYFARCSGGADGLRPPPRVFIGVAMVRPAPLLQAALALCFL